MDTASGQCRDQNSCAACNLATLRAVYLQPETSSSNTPGYARGLARTLETWRPLEISPDVPTSAFCRLTFC